MSEREASAVNIGYRNGILNEIIMYDPTRVRINDCRIREVKGEPFITVQISDDVADISAYLPLDLARKLGQGLVALFQEAESPPVDFPAAVDPVAEIEREAKP